MDARIKELYSLWSEDKYFSESTREELHSIKDDEIEITERFYKDLQFGTGGLRGIIGAGTNRINTYTIALATEGFARVLDKNSSLDKKKAVVISYDPRKYSKEFSLITALVFATHGIKVYLSDEIRPTPMLSFAVRYFNAIGGVMVTASHNPAKYNGYKTYGEDGGQMPPETADDIIDEIKNIKDITKVNWITKEEALSKGLLEYFGKEVDDQYISMLKKLVISPKAIKDNEDMKIVYTSLHGTGLKPVMRILDEIGFKAVSAVPEQMIPDPNFSTVEFPNPEERSALKMAIELAEKKGADLVVANDPDGDRTGLAVRVPTGGFEIMSGNQIGLLLMDYILSAKQKEGLLTNKSFCITTIVSTKLTRRIADKYGVKLFEVLTGFKFIGEIIKKYDEYGDMNFEFGFEESFGYLAGKDVRDKDGVVSVMLIAEMAAAARSKGMTLFDVLNELYNEYGYAAEKTISITLEGKEGAEKMKSAMESLRMIRTKEIGGIKVQSLSDYERSVIVDMDTKEEQPLDFEKSNVLLFSLEKDDWFCIRPSGTEPKIKVYFGIYGKKKQECELKLAHVSENIEKLVRGML